ncbi:MAG: glycine zipper 2TM domain-containing protein [Alphaproteobacteria bacterium]|nr:glycine zipper 2TM domain-containing protein [Alphaproteobacteria bacterium]
MRVLPLMLALCVAANLAACAPANTNTTYTSADIGRTAQIAYGVIVSMREVRLQGQPTGVGTVGGAAAGAVAGSYIGGRDPRANVLGAIGGAIIGGLAGNAVEGAASTGTAVEFIIREDTGHTISVVQTNEEQFRPGERVVLTRGARTRIARAAPGV